MPRQKRSLSNTISHLFRRFFDLDDPASSTTWTTTTVMGGGEEEEGVVLVTSQLNFLSCHTIPPTSSQSHPSSTPPPHLQPQSPNPHNTFQSRPLTNTPNRKPLTTTNLKSHQHLTSTSTHSHTRDGSHKLAKSAPTTYTGTTAASGTISKANEVYIHRSPSGAGREERLKGEGGERLKEEGKEGVTVKSVETVRKIVGSSSNGNQNSYSDTTSNPKITSRLQSSAPSQGQGKTSGGGTNGLGVVGGIGISVSSGGSSSSAAAVLTAANTSFELTPLSGLIKQSYKDIGTLRAIQAEKAKMVREGGVSERGGGEGGVWGEEVDFDGMEEHLRRFEEVYRQFLRYGGRHGDSQEEVHLVAILCKRSDVLSSTSNTLSKRGGSGSGNESEKDGKLQKGREKDCGF